MVVTLDVTVLNELVDVDDWLEVVEVELISSQLSLLWENNEVKDLIISAHGLLPILEILEPRDVTSNQTMVFLNSHLYA